MITKQQKIDKIYEVMAERIYDDGVRSVELADGLINMQTKEEQEYKLPVMIGDVLDRMTERGLLGDAVYAKNAIRGGQVGIIANTQGYLLTHRETKRKPIEDQSDECITFIYNLLPQGS